MMKLPPILLIAAMAAASLNAAEFKIPIATSDQQYNNLGVGTWDGQANLRVGQQNGAVDPKQYWEATLPFELPAIPDGEVVTSAVLTVNLEGWTSFAPIGPLQLWGIKRTSALPTVIFASDFVNAKTSDSTVVLDTELVPYSAIAGSTTATDQTAPHSSINISSFVQSLYDTYGGKAGDFAFLTMGVDNSTASDTSNIYYVISAADSGTPAFQPTITITTGAAPKP